MQAEFRSNNPKLLNLVSRIMTDVFEKEHRFCMWNSSVDYFFNTCKLSN